jgi:hypothetical protein
VVVSNDLASRYGQTVTVVPTRSFPGERAACASMVDLRAPRSSLQQARVANASMMMTYDRGRAAACGWNRNSLPATEPVLEP